MVNEVEKHIKEAGPSTPVTIHPQAEEAGVVSQHEDEEHRKILAALKSAHTEATVTGEAHPPSIEPTPGLIQVLEQKPEGGSFGDTFGWLRVIKQRRNEQVQRRGGVKNAA